MPVPRAFGPQTTEYIEQGLCHCKTAIGTGLANAAGLPYAAEVAAAAAALVVAWGLFVWLNRATEELEPEGMREAKEEDKKMRR